MAGSLTILSACGGGGESSAQATGASEGVATLETDTASDESAFQATEGDATLDADEAALAFSACMRNEGLDFPDIGVDADGNPQLRDAFRESGIDPRSEEFRTARAACADTLGDIEFGGGRQRPADNPEVQDAFVAYSECLRDEGLDVGDLQLGGCQGGGPGGQPPEDAASGDGGGQRGQGQGRGGFADRSARIANALDLDPEDPQVIAATETCGPILDGALGQPGAGRGVAGDGDA